jgi:hypothetical protein
VLVNRALLVAKPLSPTTFKYGRNSLQRFLDVEQNLETNRLLEKARSLESHALQKKGYSLRESLESAAQISKPILILRILS